MYCPRCSQQQISDEMRFCSHCGLKLSVVRALLNDEANDANPIEETKPSKNSSPPRQRDINIGALLMFIGSILMLLVRAVRISGIAHKEAPIIAICTLFGFFVFILLFTHPVLKLIYKLISDKDARNEGFSVSRRDMSLGMIMMFLCSLFAWSLDIFIPAIGAPAYLLGIPFMLALILLEGHRVISLLQNLLSGRKADTSNFAGDNYKGIASVINENALPPMQSVPVSSFNTQRVNTAEMIDAPSSITERTTNLLNDSNKQTSA